MPILARRQLLAVSTEMHGAVAKCAMRLPVRDYPGNSEHGLARSTTKAGRDQHQTEHEGSSRHPASGICTAHGTVFSFVCQHVSTPVCKFLCQYPHRVTYHVRLSSK